MDAIEHVRQFVRTIMRQIARAIDSLSGGHIKPNQITFFSILLHVLVAWVIVEGYLGLGAILLAIFALMDSLDGELARLQGRASSFGIIVDASADRLKEGIIYAAIVVFLAQESRYSVAGVAVMALTLSLLVSYIKSKGEAVLSSDSKVKLSPQELNRKIGRESLMRFEVRMTTLVMGLLTGFIGLAVSVIAVVSLMSAISRLSEIHRLLNSR